MLAVSELALGLLVAHIFLALSFLLGSVILPWFPDDTPNAPPAQRLTLNLCTCALGMASIGLLDFALASLRCFTATGVIAGYLLAIAAFCAIHRESPFALSFWKMRARALMTGWDISAICTYAGMIALAFPAILPNIGGSDPIGFHLANAADLVSSHGFAVDPFRRSPFYVGGYIPIFASFMLFNLDTFLNFATWSTGLLTALAVCASSRYIMRDAMNEPWRSLVALGLTATVILNPVYLRWGTSAYMDVQLGCFALFGVLSLLLGAQLRSRAWLLAAAIVCGFFISLKPSFILLVPVFAIGFIICANRLTAFRGRTIVVLLAFLAAASPWYVRNLILAGDPIPPTFNIALYGNDGFVSKPEWDAIISDIHTTRNAKALAALPLRAFLKPQDNDFRENGTSALFTLLYLPALICLVLLFVGKKLDATLLLLTCFLTSFVLYWFFTSTLLRYAMVFTPLLAVTMSCVCVVAVAIVRRSNLSQFAAPSIALLAAMSVLPSPGSSVFYHKWKAQYQGLVDYPGFEKYAPIFGNGDAEAIFTLRQMRNAKLSTRVYVVGSGVAYYFSRADVSSMGDWTGPAGWFRLYGALDAGRLGPYLDDLGAGVVLIEPSRIIGGLDVPLTRALVDTGYCSVSIPNSVWQLYLKEKCKSTKEQIVLHAKS